MRKDGLSYIKQTLQTLWQTQMTFTKVMRHCKCRCKCSIIVNILRIRQMQSCNVEWNTTKCYLFQVSWKFWVKNKYIELLEKSYMTI